jgi:hypothetical protein
MSETVEIAKLAYVALALKDGVPSGGGGGVLLASTYNPAAVNGMLLCSMYNPAAT